MTDYEKFVKAVRKKLKYRLGEAYQINVDKTLGNNDTKQLKLSISEKGEQVQAGIKMESYYHVYGEQNPDKAAEAIAKLYLNNRDDNYTQEFADMENYQGIKDKILFKLVNTEANRKRLKTIPSIPCMDLSIIFYIYLKEDGNNDGFLTALISNEHMAAWGVNAYDLYAAAVINTPLYLPADFKRMNEVLEEMANEMMDETYRGMTECLLSEIDKVPPLYVLSNKIGIGGAVVILYPGVLKMCKNKLKGDFYIIPSSIHETLLAACTDENDLEFLNQMVREINRRDVPEEDVLSDHVYRYDSQKETITVAFHFSIR